MAWSEKAIEAAYLKLVGALDENMMEHHLQDVCQLIITALDAAAAVDGDAQWNEADVARAICRVQLNGGDPDQPAIRWNGTDMEPQEFPAWKDCLDEARAAIRSLKRLK